MNSHNSALTLFNIIVLIYNKHWYVFTMVEFLLLLVKDKVNVQNLIIVGH